MKKIKTKNVEINGRMKKGKERRLDREGCTSHCEQKINKFVPNILDIYLNIAGVKAFL
jgi:hypothetical protein